jgi:hypothetical protein
MNEVQKEETPLYLNYTISFEDQVNDLVSRSIKNG